MPEDLPVLTLIREEAERRGLADGDLADITLLLPNGSRPSFRHRVRVVDSLDAPETPPCPAP